MNNASEKLNFFLPYFLFFIMFLVPLFFLPVLIDWFDLPKIALVLLTTLLAAGLWFLQAILAKKLLFAKSLFFTPIALFAAVAILSALLTSNKILSLAGDPALYVGSFLIFVLVSQLAQTEKSIQTFLKALFFSGAVLSVLSLAQNLISLVAPLRPLQSLIFLNPGFSPAGSALSQAIFLAMILPTVAGLHFHLVKSRLSLLSTVLLAVVALGLVSTIYTLFQSRPILLPQNTGWKVATNSLGESLQTAFLGVGPGNFLDAFTINKGPGFNSSPYWNLRFTTSSNFYFYLLTTVGITGLAAFLLVAGKFIAVARKRAEAGLTQPLEKGLIAALALSLAIFALLPVPIVALVTFFALLGILSGFYKITGNAAIAAEPVDISARSSLIRPAGAVITAVALILFGYYAVQFVLADYNFAASLQAAQNNRGTDTYNLQIKASSLNPWADGYHVSYSQTNLALANALAGQPNLTDQQKQTVVTLVQQAIREGRIAVTLAPKRAADWENLSLIYRNLINFAQGADQWAVLAQNQAITLDPANPRLRLDLGGLYFAAKDYQTAGQNFAAAVNLKPDFANAHYNLAQAMKLLGLKDQATQELQQTATLVCAVGQTADCQKVNAEIEALGATPQASSSAAATGSAQTKPALATPAAQTNLPKAATKPPAQISSPGGELAQ